MTIAPRPLGTAGLCLRLTALRGASPYLVYLVEAGSSGRVMAELEADLRSFEEAVRIDAVPSSPGAPHVLAHLPSMVGGVLLVGAEGYEESDWRLLDRRRSALTRPGATVFLTTAASFAILMRVAPNLASWFGGLVFTHVDVDAPDPVEREERLAALRAWSGKTDDDVLRAAADGTLPRDPEYASWLVLLGRGDLLDDHRA
jgi:hypothetical protein